MVISKIRDGHPRLQLSYFRIGKCLFVSMNTLDREEMGGENLVLRT